MNVGGYQAVHTRPRRQLRLRTAVNAWLEEISFRAGITTAAVAFVALLAIAAGVYAATAGHGRTAGAVNAGNHPGTAPVAVVTSALPSKPAPPSASAKPETQRPVPARTTSPQPAVAPQPQTQAASSPPAGPQYGWRGYGSTSPPGNVPWYGGRGHGPGDPGHGGPGFPGPGFPGPGGGQGRGR